MRYLHRTSPALWHGGIRVVPAWTESDEGYLRAYEWSGALAGGARMPQEAVPTQLGPGEIAHARFAVAVSGYFGEHKEYRAKGNPPQEEQR